MKKSRLVRRISLLVAAVSSVVSCGTAGVAGQQGEGEMSVKKITVSAGKHERRLCSERCRRA